MSKVEEFIAETKLNDLLHKKRGGKSGKIKCLGIGNYWSSGSSCRNRLRSVSFLYTGLFGRV